MYVKEKTEKLRLSFFILFFFLLENSDIDFGPLFFSSFLVANEKQKSGPRGSLDVTGKKRKFVFQKILSRTVLSLKLKSL